MRQVAIIIVLIMVLGGKTHASEPYLECLDSCIKQRPQAVKFKEQRLDSLRQLANTAQTDSERLKRYVKMYDEYYAYRYDSAMAYAQRTIDLARQCQQDYYLNYATIQKALLFAIGGFYGEAESLLGQVDENLPDQWLRYLLNCTRYWLYVYWADYCEGSELAPRYQKLKKKYLAEALASAEPDTPEQRYLQAESLYLIDHRLADAGRFYAKVVSEMPVNTRLYASATYGLARCRLEQGNRKEYEHYLTLSAISDMVCPLKENLAMQELAMYLFEANPDNLKRASQYINCAMEDAQFYNNRLRMIEISKKLPLIVNTYQEKVSQQSRRVLYALIALSLLTLGTLFLVFALKRRNGQLAKQRIALDEKNAQLEELNSRLLETNKIREGYLRLFMDLCAIYIEKIANYKNLVKRKIKANQTADLVKVVSSLKLSEEDAATFFRRFDKAFLELYPNFIAEFNTLLKPDEQVSLCLDGSLPTELRIYALVRLGVKESSEIATLLFYSPQTIYNYRSTMKNKAVNKETFDEDVQKLNTLI